MPFTFTMPKLSPTMEEGTIAKWHKTEGEFVESGEVILEIATDKATVEHSALDEGWLRKILIPEGKSAIVNQAIAVFSEKKDESIEEYKPTGVVPSSKKSTASQEIAEKKTVQEEAEPLPAAMAVMQSHVFAPEPPLENYRFQFPTKAAEERLKASPLAKKLAKQRGLDLSSVKGSGPHQRIVAEDLELAQPTGVVSFGHREQPKNIPGSYVEETPAPIRKVIGERMQGAKSSIPHFYVEIPVDAQPLAMIREQLLSQQLKVTFNDFVIRAAALALRKHPNVNSGYHVGNQTILRFQTVDIAVAVGIPDGLITPIIRHADFKSLGEISVEIKVLIQRAREGKLEAQEYKGGSFTISNLGMFGVSSFQPIINPPQAAILAVSGIRDMPVVKQGLVVPGKVMNLTIAGDHRVLDGVSAAEFLKTVQNLLENPALLLL